MNIQGELFSAFSVSDISDEKRRKALERIFFHDIGNTLAAIHGAIQLTQMTPVENMAQKLENFNLVEQFVNRLIEEFNSQRQLTQAENGELKLDISDIHCNELLQQIASLYKHAEVSKGKAIILEPIEDERVMITSDRVQLMRIVSNMTKNALEASVPGDFVALGCMMLPNNQIEFYVRNQMVMPQSIKFQVFNRSFTTKGQGRGLGTYSMKLLGERYLHGKVGFTSKPGDGTRFYIKLPRNMNT